jgi:serine-type D-Ala-D-Ala carboxypeptidase (penicillin-binding protein 5/6)
MTAVVAIENYDLNKTLTVGDLDILNDSSKMNLKTGEKIRIHNLLYGLLMVSGNDAAEVLADYMPGGRDAFVKAMNQKANELNLSNTYFSDPSGYHDENYTTATELARLASYALDNDIFSKIVKTKTKTVYDESGKIVHRLENLNRLLGEEGVSGVKTGFTNEAGEVLVTSLEHNQRTFVIVVLRSNDRFSDTREIISKIVGDIQFIEY